MLAMAHGAARPRIKYGACPLLMTSLMTRVYTDEPHRCRAAKAAWSLSPKTSRTATTTADIASTAGRRSPPKAGGVATDSPEALPVLWEAKVVERVRGRATGARKNNLIAV